MLGFFKKKIPGSDTLFEKFFSPWYDVEGRPKMPKADMFQIAAYEGHPLKLAEIQYLPDDYVTERTEHINSIIK